MHGKKKGNGKGIYVYSPLIPVEGNEKRRSTLKTLFVVIRGRGRVTNWIKTERASSTQVELSVSSCRFIACHFVETFNR